MNTAESEAYRLAYELEYAAKYPNVRMASDHEMLKAAAAELKRLWKLAYVDKPDAQWVGLAPADFDWLEQMFASKVSNDFVFADIVCAIEAKLRSKNGY